MGKERLSLRVDPETKDAINEYAEERDVSKSEAGRRMLRSGLSSNGYEIPVADGMGATRDDMNDRMSNIERRQRLQFSASLSVIAGLSWAVVTLTTNASGPLWATAGLLAMATLGGINYLLGDADE